MKFRPRLNFGMVSVGYTLPKFAVTEQLSSVCIEAWDIIPALPSVPTLNTVAGCSVSSSFLSAVHSLRSRDLVQIFDVWLRGFTESCTPVFGSVFQMRYLFQAPQGADVK